MEVGEEVFRLAVEGSFFAHIGTNLAIKCSKGKRAVELRGNEDVV